MFTEEEQYRLMTDPLLPVVDALVPDAAAKALTRLVALTGQRWGPTPPRLFWFQPPKVHIFLSAVFSLLCAALCAASWGFGGRATAQIAAESAGWSTRCPLNRVFGYVLLLCLASQVYLKAVRPRPLIQLGWLLMPCHLITAMWCVIFLLREEERHYAWNCLLGSLLVNWAWGPIGATAQPDWGDHQYRIEGVIFVVHHGLLCFMPLYFATRYHTLALSVEFLLFQTWIPTIINFLPYTAFSMLSGLNLNYMLYPPKLKGVPPVFCGIWYRVAIAGTLAVLSIICNLLFRTVGGVLAAVVSLAGALWS